MFLFFVVLDIDLNLIQTEAPSKRTFTTKNRTSIVKCFVVQNTKSSNKDSMTHEISVMLQFPHAYL